MTPQPPRHPAWLLAGLFGVVAIACVAALAFGQPVTPVQRGKLQNSETTALAGAATITLTPLANQHVHVYSLKAACSAGTSTVAITDAGTTVWSLPAGAITNVTTGVAWTPAPLTGSLGGIVVVTLSTCGGGNTGTLAVQADIY